MTRPVKEEHSITEFRKKLAGISDDSGITPVTVNGKFTAVIITFPEMTETQAKNALQRLHLNPLVGVNELIEESSN